MGPVMCLKGFEAIKTLQVYGLWRCRFRGLQGFCVFGLKALGRVQCASLILILEPRDRIDLVQNQQGLAHIYY